MEAWICPFCHQTFDDHEIKDHISQEHFGVQAPLPLKTNDLLIKQEPEQIQVVPDFVFEGDSSLEEESAADHFLNTTENYEDLGIDEWPLVNNEGAPMEVDGDLKPSLKCPECPKVFSHRKSLSRHIKSTHDEEIFHCDFCGKDFNNKENLKRHVERGHGRNTQYQCFKCQEMLSSKETLLEHIKSVHGHMKHDCETCQKSFATNDGLKRHLRTTHEGFKERPSKISSLVRNDDKAIVECQACHKVYASKKALWRHNNSVHQGIKHECSTCQKIFSTSDTLRRHIKSVHLKLKRSDLSLKRHHHCHQCPKSFRDKRDLNVHVASVHEGIRISCEHCPSHFKALKSYKRHRTRKHGI